MHRAALAVLTALLAAAAAALPLGASAAPPAMRDVVVTLKSQADLSGIGGRKEDRLREAIRRRRTVSDRGYGGFVMRIATWRRQGKIAKVTRFWVINGFALTATPEVIGALAADPLVAKVEPDAKGTLVPAAAPAEPNIARIGAPAVWDTGDRGAGVVVATLDSGVDMTNPDLLARWRGGSNSWFDPFGQHTDGPMDRSGHGTQVMGVIEGGGSGGTSIGVAPGATWIAARVFNDAGQSSISATHLAFQWVLDPDGNPSTADAPQIVNASWSFASGGCNLEFANDIQTLRAAGILPVFAAGNFGSLSASPGNNPGAVSVGSVTASDAIAGDSSQGPTTCGQPATIFPTLTAPGVKINTADLAGFTATVTGTSIAAPHVAGVAALMLSAHPRLTLAEQENALESTAVDLGAPGPDNVFGHGLVNAQAAVAMVAAMPPGADTTGPVVNSPAVAPSPVATGTVRLTATAVDAQGTTAAAEWFDGADPGVGQGAPMVATDGTFDTAAEAVQADINATALSPGAHSISVRARDNSGNWGAPAVATLVVDRSGPDVSAVSAAPNPTASADVTLTASATDASAITAAEWFEGANPGAGAGTAMAPADGAWGGASEGLRATVPTASLAPGVHTLSVRARDAAGNWGPAVGTVLTIDRTAPTTTNAVAAPALVSSGNVTLTATAAADLAVAGAEWFDGADPGQGAGTPMSAAGGAFGGTSATLGAAIPAAGLGAGIHILSVRSRDTAGNWSAPAAATVMVDRTGPGISGAAVTPSPTQGAASVVLSATATDPANGSAAGSAVTAAEWFDGADPGAGAGTAMTPADGAFDATSEAVRATIATAGMAAGQHVLTVRARDAAGNWGPGTAVTLTVSASPVIFADGFESGNLSAWSASSGGPSRLAVVAAARLDGAYGLRATISGNSPSWVDDARPTAETAYTASVALNPNNVNIGSATVPLLRALTGGASPVAAAELRIRRLTSPTRYQAQLAVARRGGTSATAWVGLPSGWGRVGLSWASGTSASASLKVGGSTAATLTGLDTSAYRIETSRLGPSAGLASGMSGSLYLDSFTSSR